MQSIGSYIVSNANKNIEQPVTHSVIQNGIEMDMNLPDMIDELFKIIDISQVSDFKSFPENLGIQRKQLISFKYKEKTYVIGEHFCTQRSYFWVKISY